MSAASMKCSPRSPASAASTSKVATVDAGLILAPALFVMGVGAGAIITPNQALTLMEVDPVSGSTAGGVLQTAQRIGLAIGQAVIGAVFFAGLGRTAASYPHALRAAVAVALGFVCLAAVVGLADLLRTRGRARSARLPSKLVG
jgi:hypothetical protein